MISSIYIPILLRSTIITVTIALLSATISLIVGTCLGIISCNYVSRPKVLRLIKIYTFISKGIPAYVQILIAYFAIPYLLGINIPGFLAAAIALSFCSSGYFTEIIRAGINSVPLGQWQACFALGYSLRDTLQRVIFPQAIKNISPALFGEFEQLLKSTSLAATIGVTELTRTGLNIISRELNPIPVYITIAAIYLLLSAGLSFISGKIEKRVNYVNS